ncbi:MAG: peptidoglycan-binding protein [Clostridia bacterium]|nr:peptidoglycan-binding protein [Clostridia bacterium]
MLKIKRALALFLILAVILTISVVSGASVSAAGTGIGLSEHVLNAYYSGWSYVYGCASEGAVDCSGLIYMYAGGDRCAMIDYCQDSGYVSDGVPNIHGLGLYQPGHVGVYVGNGMAVDARSSDYGICYESVYDKDWSMWFKHETISYPDTGWEYFSGNYYYYEDGEYLTDAYITVDGIEYYLDASGACTSTPGDTGALADTPSDYDAEDELENTENSESEYIKLGSTDERVSTIQERLKELGFYNDEITGYYGSMTEAAYMEFQIAAGLYADGIAGPYEIELLLSSDAPYAEKEEGEEVEETEPADEKTETEEEIAFSNGDYNDSIYEIQAELQNLGYFNDDATGYYGDMTENAVADFQAQNGLEPTGEVDELTYAAIFSSTALENPNAADIENAETLTPPAKADKEKENSTAPTTTTPATKPVKENVAASSACEEVTLKSAELAAKALEGIEFEGIEADKDSSRSGSFIIWLLVMVAFMSGAFWFVYSNEKKKKKARYERIKARANRNW